MRMDTCCFTGHRRLDPAILPELRQAIAARIEQLIAQGVRYFVCGGALGFDTLAEETVLEARARHTQVKLILILPCRDQAVPWGASDRQRYDHLLAAADQIVYVQQTYTRGCMQRRNRHMVDSSGHCIYYLTRQGGGTAYTADYAHRKGLRLYPLLNSQIIDH